jgi:dUTP pyrophosphatase
MTIVRIVNKSKNSLPEYATTLSAGMDLKASIENEQTIWIKPFERVLIKTDLFIELPVGFEAQIRPRSGLALKHGITVLNTPGTIDADYRGNIGVILINLSDKDFAVNQGDRIAQMVITKVEQVKLDSVLVISDTVRGENGFGSTKIK